MSKLLRRLKMNSTRFRLTEWFNSNPRHQLLTILVIALVFRFAFVLVLNPEGIYFSDTRHYDRAARNLLQGEGFGEKYDRSPLYPLFMAGVYGLLGTSFVAMRIVEALLGVLLCYLIFRIGERLFDRKVALVAAAIAAIFPHFLLIVGILYPTNLFTVLIAASIFFLLHGDEHHSFGYYALSGGLAGAATLTTPALFFALPFWFLWLLVGAKQGGGYRVASAALFLILFAAVLTPWTLRNYQKYDRFVLVRPVPHTAFPDLENVDSHKTQIENGFNETTEYLKAHPTGTDEDAIPNIMKKYLNHPVESIQYSITELGHFWSLYPDRLDTKNKNYVKEVKEKDSRIVSAKPSGFWRLVKIGSIAVMLPTFLFAVIGLVSTHPFRRKKILILLTILAISFGYSLIVAEVRYRIPLEPYILMFTAAGLIAVFEKLTAHQQTKNSVDELNKK